MSISLKRNNGNPKRRVPVIFADDVSMLSDALGECDFLRLFTDLYGTREILPAVDAAAERLTMSTGDVARICYELDLARWSMPDNAFDGLGSLNRLIELLKRIEKNNA